jgi:hypothetical protein
VEPGGAAPSRLSLTGPTFNLGPSLRGFLVTTTTPFGRAAALCLTLATAVVAAIALAAPASATAYRYWSYWQGASGQWVAAQTGPGQYELVDQDVQGWRFAISTEAVTQSPDNAPEFSSLCPDLAASEPAAGQLRVALVIDSGFAADAPAGQTPPADVVACVTVPEGSTGNQALAAGAAVTDQDGLVCGINGYPEGECGAAVSDADAATAAEAASAEQPNPAVISAGGSDSADQAADDSGSWIPVAMGAVVLALLLGAAWAIPALRRRSRSASA